MLFKEHISKTLAAKKLGVCRLTLYKHLWTARKKQMQIQQIERLTSPEEASD